VNRAHATGERHFTPDDRCLVSRSEVEAYYARFSHLFDCEADSFATDAAHFRPPEGHDVQTVIGRIIDHHPADFQPAYCREGIPQVLSENCRMQTVWHAVRPDGYSSFTSR
jgi:hypothetical protein